MLYYHLSASRTRNKETGSIIEEHPSEVEERTVVPLRCNDGNVFLGFEHNTILTPESSDQSSSHQTPSLQILAPPSTVTPINHRLRTADLPKTHRRIIRILEPIEVEEAAISKHAGRQMIAIVPARASPVPVS